MHAAVNNWIVSPFLHHEQDRIYDPLTDRSLASTAATYSALAAAITTRSIDGLDSAAITQLAADGWLLPRGSDNGARYRLKIVSLETNTVCNQACYFCPVSVDPRDSHAMPDELFVSIAKQLTAYRETLEAVFLQSYNEPTADARFLAHCEILAGLGLPIAILTNGSGLTPQKVDALVEKTPLRYMAVNLSTLDREKYRRDRGVDHLNAVLRNLDYAKSRPVAQEMKIVVLGTGDEAHRTDFAQIAERFAGSRFAVESFEVMDRAGYLRVGLTPAKPPTRLAGCENIGSRPLQHLHITPHGQCVLCCEDYDEKYVVGDLTQSTVSEVLTGAALAQMRRWAYGIEDAPADFICRNCIYARDAAAQPALSASSR